MSNEDTVSKLRFTASKPEIAEIQKDLEYAIDGRHTVEVVIALVRVLGDIIAEANPESTTELLRHTAIALGDRVARAGRLA
jgi:uncharacterized membrane protein